MDTDKTMVIFRKYKPSWHDEGDVIALFPCQQDSMGYVLSYEHLGQHGRASYNGILKQTRRTTPEEAIDLADELKDIGYNLATRQKRPSHRYQQKWLDMGNS